LENDRDSGVCKSLEDWTVRGGGSGEGDWTDGRIGVGVSCAIGALDEEEDISGPGDAERRVVYGVDDLREGGLEVGERRESGGEGGRRRCGKRRGLVELIVEYLCDLQQNKQ